MRDTAKAAPGLGLYYLGCSIFNNGFFDHSYERDPLWIHILRGVDKRKPQVCETGKNEIRGLLREPVSGLFLGVLCVMVGKYTVCSFIPWRTLLAFTCPPHELLGS